MSNIVTLIRFEVFGPVGRLFFIGMARGKAIAPCVGYLKRIRDIRVSRGKLAIRIKQDTVINELCTHIYQIACTGQVEAA